MKDYFSNKIDIILRSFNGYNINNYINLISGLDNNMNESIRLCLIELIKNLDDAFHNSIEKKRKYHIKDYRKHTILTIFGKITYYRTFYKSKLNGNCFCYVDRLLGLKKYDYFDPYIKLEILSYVSDNNYSDTAKHVNSLIENRISLDTKDQIITR